jgi:hypothetical protein
MQRVYTIRSERLHCEQQDYKLLFFHLLAAILKALFSGLLEYAFDGSCILTNIRQEYSQHFRTKGRFLLFTDFPHAKHP